MKEVNEFKQVLYCKYICQKVEWYYAVIYRPKYLIIYKHDLFSTRIAEGSFFHLRVKIGILILCQVRYSNFWWCCDWPVKFSNIWALESIKVRYSPYDILPTKWRMISDAVINKPDLIWFLVVYHLDIFSYDRY